MDDYVYIGAGANSAKLMVMFIVTLFAKLVKSFVEIGIAYAGLGKIFPAAGFFGLSRLTNSILL